MRYKGKHFKKEEKFGFKVEAEYLLWKLKARLRKLFK